MKSGAGGHALHLRTLKGGARELTLAGAVSLGAGLTLLGVVLAGFSPPALEQLASEKLIRPAARYVGLHAGRSARHPE